jgi:hypothetical protein
MLQVGYGGYYLVGGNVTEYVDSPTYYEPGFNVMYPIEIAAPKSDRFFILIRKREDESGDGFANLVATNVSATAVDATNGESLLVRTSNNTLHPAWNQDPSSTTPVLLQIDNQLDMVNTILRVRVIDCKVKDSTDNSFINFRVIIEEDPEDLYFNYIPVHRRIYPDRNTFSIAGRSAYVTLRNDSDAYLLVSPYAWLKEDTKDKSDFSYPQDTFYYQIENTYNSEDFTFALSSYSDSFVAEHVSVLNVPGNKKVALILIDNAIYDYIFQLRSGVSLVISVVGELSGIEDTFTVNLNV